MLKIQLDDNIGNTLTVRPRRARFACICARARACILRILGKRLTWLCLVLEAADEEKGATRGGIRTANKDGDGKSIRQN